MDIKKTLAEFKEKADKEIVKIIEKEENLELTGDSVVIAMMEYGKKMLLAGGKRVRPAFMCYGYLAAGGKDVKEILKVSTAVEIVHLFLLIHDDIMDRDLKRHGIDTAHYHFEKLGKKLFITDDEKHFGESIGIILGDRLQAMGNKILYESNFSPELVVTALRKLQDIVSYTIAGQTMDICIEYRKKATEKEILKMLEYKTARYTIEGPMHLGAMLAGADKKFLDAISAYSVPVGIAFQIQDDILGIFGSEEKLGKRVGSDIREGKITLLVSKTRELGNRKQVSRINKLLGKQDITEQEVEEFRNIIEETGALEYSKNLSTELVEKGKRVVEKMSIDAESKDFLISMADYMVNRSY